MDAGNRATSKQCSDHTVHNDSRPHRHTPRCFISTEERGKGAAVTMLVNGAKVAGGDMPRTIPLQISLNEGIDIGMDIGSAVDFTYKLPFTFTGTIDKVTIELERAGQGQ